MLGAVETGGTSVRATWGSGPEQLEAVEEFATGSEPADVVERLAAFFARAPPLRAVGVAAFGPLEVDPGAPGWGRLLATPKPGWSGAPLGPELARRLRVPIALDTDVNAAALAEARWGAGRGSDPVAYLTVGTGIGLGAVVGGRTLRGLLHPEAGHLRIARAAADRYPGRCPFHGAACWEGLASGPAIAERWGAEPADLPDGHPAWELEAGYLAAGLASVVLVLSPQAIVLGGGVGRRAGMLEAVAARLPEQLAGALERTPRLVAPRFGGRSGLVGALALACAVAGP